MSWVPGNIVTVNTPNITSFPDGSRLFKWTSYERPTWSADGRNLLYFAVNYSHLCEEENGQPTFCYLVRADKVALYNGLLGSPESQSFASYELTQEQGLLAPDTLFVSSFNTYKLFFRWAQVQLPTPTPTPAPTFTPSPTPLVTPPIWGESGEVIIDVLEAIPSLSDQNNETCERTPRIDSRRPCAIYAFEQYRSDLGGSMTWGQFVALVAYAEGNTLLLGSEDGELGNPQLSGLGVCWRFAVGNWLSGANQCVQLTF